MEQPALGIKITELRNSAGITQKELADKCKVDIRTIQRIEAGEVSPRMYTLNLLSAVLAFNFNTTVTTEAANLSLPRKTLKLAFIAGIIYSVNAIPVVIELTKHPFGVYARALTFAIHSISSIVFFYGFYIWGKYSKNQILTMSSLLCSILLPLTNLFYFINPLSMGVVFILLCINCIFFGVGIFIQASKGKLKWLYTFAGIIGIVQSCMFLSFIFSVQTAGLIISIGSDMLLVAILFLEYQNSAKKILFSGKNLIMA